MMDVLQINHHKGAETGLSDPVLAEATVAAAAVGTLVLADLGSGTAWPLDQAWWAQAGPCIICLCA